MKRKILITILLLISCFATANEKTTPVMNESSFLQEFSKALGAKDQPRMEELVRLTSPHIVYSVIISQSTRGITSVAEGKDGSTHLNTAEAMATIYAKEFKKEALLEQVRKYKLYDRGMSQEKLKGDRLIREGLSSYRKSQWEEALRQFNEALVAFDKIGDLFGRSRALGYMGNTDTRLGNYDRALSIYQQDLELKRTMGDVRGEAAVLSNIGTTYNSLKQYDEALKFYHQSIEGYQRNKDQAGETRLLREIENIHEKLKKDSQGR